MLGEVNVGVSTTTANMSSVPDGTLWIATVGPHYARPDIRVITFKAPVEALPVWLTVGGAITIGGIVGFLLGRR